ncbi:GNAT family N-acetyltransferase [Rhizobiaceae bacterium n13]|uniref:GNAT family N-acetyltransferase n=1 Tax=Ferirhizobium litorale TaxID=2927786 RepID=A0AAE3QE25_9HYPH|nr:GNAT family N-acetyltransferase [Fererhizobium litorale]MDI7861351.1 GNAT family N-acetyltransferase [Fererhizobium litorale]MDI7921498.1 GNAT family N-acetyltransferase [Fererhizobium litorale]
MISLSTAKCAEDFEIAAEFGRAFGEWDAVEGLAYGLDPEEVRQLYHNDTSSSLARKFSAGNGVLYLARSDGALAGSLGFDTFDETTAELQKFYVDPKFRGKGIGSALMRTALAEIGKSGFKRVVLHTTVYMRNAISVYEACGFIRCPPFRAVPDSVAHTEIFMAREM